MSALEDSPISERSEAGAPGPDIEITPEMIEAGVRLLHLYDAGSAGREFERELVGEIFKKMVRLRPFTRSNGEQPSKSWIVPSQNHAERR